jgi:hypothetical protein
MGENYSLMKQKIIFLEWFLNDWSAIFKMEYVPLGPFLAKNFFFYFALIAALCMH